MIIPSIVIAFITQQHAAQELSTVPTKVVVDSSGKASVDFIEMKRFDPDNFPDEIPCFSVMPDGTLSSGVTYTGSSQSGVHSYDLPYQLIQNQDGSWELIEASWTVYHGPIGKEWTRQIPGSESIPVYSLSRISQLPQAQADTGSRGAGPAINWTYDHNTTFPKSALRESQMERVINKAVERWKQLLIEESLIINFHFQWDLSPELGLVAAYADTFMIPRTFASTRVDLSSAYNSKLNDADAYEQTIISSLTSSNNYNYTTDSGTSSSSTIYVNEAVLSNFGLGTPPKKDLVINLGQQWQNIFGIPHLDPSSPVPEDESDFLAILIHEIGHHLGMTSRVEVLAENVSASSITLWDYFRVDSSAGSVSGFEFRTLPREMRLSTIAEPVGILAINSGPWTKLLSLGADRIAPFDQGDGRTSPHWKDNDLIGGKYVGIMDPTLGPEDSYIVNNRYIQEADIRMLDIQGYNIDRSNFAVSYGSPSASSPIGNTEVAVDSTLTFDWNNGSGSLYSDLIVYDLGTSVSAPERGILGDPVYRAEALSGSTHTVDPVDFIPLAGHQYQWHIASWNPLGVSFTTPETFVVDCPADINDDNNINFIDVSEFLAAYGNQDPIADFEPDDMFNFLDVNAFLAAYGAGCP